MAVAAGLGMVPLVGDVGVAMYKCNSRNAALLEEFLRIRGAEYLRQEAQAAGAGGAGHATDVEVVGAPGSAGSAGMGAGVLGADVGDGSQIPGVVDEGEIAPEDAVQVKPGAGMKAGEKATA